MSGGRHRVDPEDGMREVFDLWSAETAEDLHRVLVLYPPIRGSFDAFEPFCLLQKHHETEPETSAVTAVLLLTDGRWRGGVGALARRIGESGLLGDEQLDLLARTFLLADDAVYWQVPDEWFSEEGIIIDLGEETAAVDHDEACRRDRASSDARSFHLCADGPPLMPYSAIRMSGAPCSLAPGI